VATVATSPKVVERSEAKGRLKPFYKRTLMRSRLAATYFGIEAWVDEKRARVFFSHKCFALGGGSRRRST
jgi:hypothetical protein